MPAFFDNGNTTNEEQARHHPAFSVYDEARMVAIQENIALAPLTTLGVGGAARYFAAAHTVADATEALVWARERQLPVFILGGGSNLVVSDAGFAVNALKKAKKDGAR